MTATHPPTGSVTVVEDPRYLDHAGPPQHPECPERLSAVSRALSNFRASLTHQAPVPADPGAILRVHSRDHLDAVENACLTGHGHLDADTYVSPQSFDTALLASGGTVELARAIARGATPSGFAVVRPPGHHAESTHAMGFCLFNNIAIAARALQREEGLERLLILDWDVHHGNGTQHTFEDEDSVLFVSTHQFPYYPGTGNFHEIGRGAGEGFTLNIPMPAGCGDHEYQGVLARLVVPAAMAFRPEMILVSCGFDAHRDDPLASMRLSEQGFLAMTRTVRALADQLCEGRVCFVLEGGYAAESLFEGTTALLEGLLETPGVPAHPPIAGLEPGAALSGIVERVVAVHGSRVPGLGAA